MTDAAAVAPSGRSLSSPFPAESDPLLEVRVRARSKEPHLLHANIVLTALTDVIASQGITASSSKQRITHAYFGALMVSLDQQQLHSADTVAGITHLLSLIFPQLAPSVLRAKAADIAPILLQLLEQHAETTAVAKAVLSCIATQLCALDTSSPSTFLQHSPFLHLFQALLVYSLDPRPKLRHLSQQRAAVVLSAFHGAHPQLHRALMEAVQSFAEREVQGVTGRECQEVLYLCGLLQLAGSVLSLQCRAFLLQLLLTLGQLKGNSVLYVQVMRAVVVLSGREEGDDSVEVKYVLMLDRLLTALQDAAPHLADIEANTAFSHATASTMALLVDVDAIRAGHQLLPYFRLYSSLLLSPKPAVVRLAAQSMQRLLQLAVTAQWLQAGGDDVDELLKAAEALLGYRYKSVWQHVFPVIAAVFAAFPAAASDDSATLTHLLHPLLSALDSLRFTPSIASDFAAHIDDAIAAAIAYHSPPAVLTLLPLNLPTSPALSASEFTASLASSRAYLLPLIRAHTRHTALCGWFSSLHPLLLELRVAQQRWAGEDDDVRRRACQLLEEELWDTLPSFCRYAVDVPAAMKRAARTMGDWLGSDEWQYAHGVVCKALTVLIRDNQELVSIRGAETTLLDEEEDVREAKKVFDEDDADDDDDGRRAEPHASSVTNDSKKDSAATKYPVELSALSLDTARANLAALSVYAKNFLPLLFNLVSRGEHKREVVLDAIAAYSTIADAGTINVLFKRALRKMLESSAAAAADAANEADRTRSHAVADIVLAMTAVLDADNLSFLYRSIEPQLSSADAIAQKKAYKTLAAICRHHPAYFSQHWRPILTAVTDAAAQPLSSAAKVRLTCLTALCRTIPGLLVSGEGDGAALLGHLPALLGEVLLALKDPSWKTRQAAYDFINSIGAAMRDADAALISEGKADAAKAWGLTSPDSSQPLFSEYVFMLLGGLAGTSPHMQSATVMAFSHLIFSCRRALPESMSSTLLSTLLPLLASKSREVKKSMMGLLKVVCLTLPAEALSQYAQAIVDGIGAWGEERGRNRYQEKVRGVLELLMRKLGVDEVRAMVRADQVRLVEHIRKMKAREQRSKAGAWAKRKEQRGDGKDDEGEAGKARKSDFESVLYGSDEDDEEKAEPQPERAAAKMSRRKERAREAMLSMREGTEDLLGDDMIVNLGRGDDSKDGVVAAAARLKRKQRDVRENAEGKLLVMEEEAGDDAAAMGGDEGDTAEAKGADGPTGRKRPRDEAAAGAGREKRRMLAGAAYAGKGGAGGDARRRGQKYEPYAYIPLDAAVLNRRKQVSAKKRIETAVGGNKPAARWASKNTKPPAAAGDGSGQRRSFVHSRQPKKHKK